MESRRHWARLLLWLHLFVCVVWLYLFRSCAPPGWMGHIFLWSILGIQFTWGLTVGLIVGPSRKRRPLLWWSLLTVFMPLWFFGQLAAIIAHHQGILVALAYLAAFVIIVASETYTGVIAGASLHGGQGE